MKLTIRNDESELATITKTEHGYEAIVCDELRESVGRWIKQGVFFSTCEHIRPEHPDFLPKLAAYLRLQTAFLDIELEGEEPEDPTLALGRLTRLFETAVRLLNEAWDGDHVRDSDEELHDRIGTFLKDELPP